MACACLGKSAFSKLASWVQISRLKGLHMRSVRVLEYQLMLSGACSSDAEHSSDTGLAARELESARDQPTERVILRFCLSLSLSLFQQSLSLRCA